MSKMNQNEASELFRKTPPKTEIAKDDSKKIEIRTLIDLKGLVKRLAPDSSDKSLDSIVIDSKKVGMTDEKFSGLITIPQSGGQSTLRKTILDGFEMIKNHQKYYEASLASKTSPDEYGGFYPAVVPNPQNHTTWIDTFIKNNMDGTREGLYIVWDISTGKYRLDPWTCKLEKIDAS